MAGGRSRPGLVVEGKDDQHALVHLLIRHGIDYDSEPWPESFPQFRPVGQVEPDERQGVEALLEGIPLAISLSTGKPIGFVLDADSPMLDRWRAVRKRLQEAGLSPPTSPPIDGYIEGLPGLGVRVGVWLMPDNQHDGTLETFLEELIADGDRLILHARSATTEARRLGAEFPDPDEKKAVLHAWLAWQKKPGRPYGTAIRARYFQHDSPAALAFVQWVRRLYGIQ